MTQPVAPSQAAPPARTMVEVESTPQPAPEQASGGPAARTMLLVD